MANIESTATVNLIVNGKEAEEAIKRQKELVRQLSEAAAKAYSAGDLKSAKKYETEARRARKELKNMQTDAVNVRDALERLDKLSLTDLRSTLKTLQSQLKKLPADTQEFVEKAQEIRKVKERLQEVTDELKVQKSELGGWGLDLKKAMTTAGIALGANEVIDFAQRSIDAFVSLDEAMAETRKFTGLSAEEVGEFTEKLKQIDTRSSVIQLHELAQEAGRLGLTGDDVLGYVKASDIINVALNDLGEGATLTLSKLTQVFGVDEEYGTEQSLLKLGSVINVLSQNSAASASYLADFSSRLGGIGAQANLSAQDIMAFGSVLDASVVSSEKSATALSRLISKIYTDPAKFAEAAGLEVQKFSDLVKTDMNAALLEWFGAVNKMNGMSSVAPLLDDLKISGDGLTQTISTLADKIDLVKAQQAEAQEAFNKGTSVVDEFNEANNTAGADLEKLENEIFNTSAEIGRELYPVMLELKSAGMSVIKVVADLTVWFANHRALLVPLITAILGYKTATLLTTLATKRLIIAEKLKTAGTKAWIAVQSLATVGAQSYNFIVGKVTGNVQKCTAATKALKAAMATTPWGAIGAVAGLAAGAIYESVEASKQAREEAEAMKDQAAETGDELSDITTKLDQKFAEETATLKNLYLAATDETAAKEERIKASEKLQKLYPAIFGNFSTEQIMLGQARKAYDALTASIIENARARAAAEMIVENEKKIIQTRIKWNQTVKDHKEVLAARETSNNPYLNKAYTAEAQAMNKVERGYKAEVDALEAENAELRKYAAKDAESNNPEKDIKIDYTGSGGGSKKGSGGGKGHNSSKTDQEKAKNDKAKAAIKAELDTLDADFAAIQDKLFEDYESGEKTASEFYARLYEERTDYYKKLVALYKSAGVTEKDEDLKSAIKSQESMQKELLNLKKKAIETERDAQIAELEDALKTTFNATVSQEAAAAKAINDIRVAALEKQRDLYEIGTKEHAEMCARIEKQTAEGARAVSDLLIARAKELAEELNEASPVEQYFTDLEVLVSLFNAKKITFDQLKKLLARAKMDAQTALFSTDGLAIRANTYAEAVDDYSKKLDKLNEAHARGLIDEAQLSAAIIDSKKNFLKEMGWEDADKKTRKDRKNEFEAEVALLNKALNDGMITMDEYRRKLKKLKTELNAPEQEAYDKAMADLKSNPDEFVKLAAGVADAYKQVFDSIQNGGENMLGALSAAVTATSAMINGVAKTVTEFTKAQTDLQIAQINRRFDAEISRAEGNTYMIASLERQKEDEIAAAKNEASKNEYKMQVIQAITTSIAAALAAYESTMHIPVAGPILAPLAAAIALASGMAQVALIKKQQQAAEAQGYAEGGFTKPGPKYQEAGIVHAGEWVASQELLASPVARPMIEMLDYAQRTNRIGSLTARDVSRSVALPAALNALPAAPAPVVNIQTPEPPEADTGLTDAIEQLNRRLDEPFVTVNTVTGPVGIKKAQDDYQRLIRNKSPKLKK